MRDEYDFTPEQFRKAVRGKYAAHLHSAADESPVPADALSILEDLTGSVEAPSDWAAEHDHYLYGTPKRSDGKQ
jgi:hypothetical protein